MAASAGAPTSTRAVLVPSAAPWPAPTPLMPAAPALAAGLGAGSWFPAGPAFAGRQDGESALSQHQSPLGLGGRGAGGLCSPGAILQRGLSRLTGYCRAAAFAQTEAQPALGKSQMLTKEPLNGGLGGAPGGQKPTTESHIMDTPWGRGNWRTKDPFLDSPNWGASGGEKRGLDTAIARRPLLSLHPGLGGPL